MSLSDIMPTMAQKEEYLQVRMDPFIKQAVKNVAKVRFGSERGMSTLVTAKLLADKEIVGEVKRLKAEAKHENEQA